MYISKIHIKNFKCFKEITINFDPNINIIIGGNNAGKSTMFEAFRLWNLAFNQFLKERTNNGAESSFYTTEYFSFTLSDVKFLRVNSFDALLNNKANATLIISIFLTKGDGVEVELPIEFTKTTEGHNLRFSLCKTDVDKKRRINASNDLLQLIGKGKGSSFKDLLFCTYLYPMFLLPINEPAYGEGYVKHNLHLANAENVLRNLLNIKELPLKNSYKRSSKNKYVARIEKYLHEIIKGEVLQNRDKPYLSFVTDYKKDESAFVNIYAETEDKNKVEVAQLGSGTINLINIIATLIYGDYKKFHLSLLLLDEPDSHLHANHQKQLFNFLNKISEDENKQIFIISHNHELIDNFNKVLFVDKDNMKNNEIMPIVKDDYLRIYKSIAPEYHQKMLEISEAQKGRAELEKKLEKISKPIVMVEGDSDVSILKHAYKKLYGKDFFDNKVDLISSTNSVSGIKNAILSNIKTNIMGIVDCDQEGIGPYNDLKNNKSFTEEDGILKNKESSVFFMKLPVPEYRSQLSEFFDNNTFIEYLFTDDVLEKCGVELETRRGNSFKTIKGHYNFVTSRSNKNSKSELDSAKTIFHSNLDKLEKEDFKEFYKIFEAIASCFSLEILQ